MRVESQREKNSRTGLKPAELASRALLFILSKTPLFFTRVPPTQEQLEKAQREEASREERLFNAWLSRRKEEISVEREPPTGGERLQAAKEEAAERGHDYSGGKR